jgi:hypothetical protein
MLQLEPLVLRTASDSGPIYMLGLNVRVLEDLRTAGLNPQSVGDRQLVEEGAHCFDDCRREELFVFSRQR